MSPSPPPPPPPPPPQPADPDVRARLAAAIGSRFQIGSLVARSPFRLLFEGTDRTLRRPISIRVCAGPDPAIRAWFLTEAEALAQLDHPAIRRIYDVGGEGDLVWRVGNWIDGEGLDEAVRRAPRPIPQVHILARALLGALEHAHGQGIIVRRILPTSLIVASSGRGTLTDLRHSSYTLAHIPPSERLVGQAFMAPEVREGGAGDPASDVYTAAAVLYFALTGLEPALETSALALPTRVRPNIPHVFDRLLQRGLAPDPSHRYHTAWNMYDDFASDAGDVASQATFVGPPQPGEIGETPAVWEKRLRRALGDDYELLGEIGRGGFGRVYRVRDLHLERVVALKVLDPILASEPDAVERFRREAQLAARLRHPHVVDIYEIGGRYGLIWYTMELVEGPNLAQRVGREGPLDRAEVLRLLREGLSALAEAHRLGMVHRDIKPENMLIEPGTGLKITDFGLALALRGGGRLGGTGGAISRSGTPQFASPEQLLGETVDQRTDLYSLAAVALYALLGRPPFTGRTTREILAKQTIEALPDLERERPEIGPALALVLIRALRSAPEDRYPSAEAFLQALNYGAQPLPQAEAASWGEQAARWFRSRGSRAPGRGPDLDDTP